MTPRKPRGIHFELDWRMWAIVLSYRHGEHDRVFDIQIGPFSLQAWREAS